MCRDSVLAFLAFLFLIGEAAAQRATPWGDDVGEFYRAAAQGDEVAMLRTALRLAEGRRGSHWATVVGDLYWQGQGAAADPTQAVKWYRRAAVRGGDLAMLALARAHPPVRARSRTPRPHTIGCRRRRLTGIHALSSNRRSIPVAAFRLCVTTRTRSNRSAGVSSSSISERESRRKPKPMRCPPVAPPMFGRFGYSRVPGPRRRTTCRRDVI